MVKNAPSSVNVKVAQADGFVVVCSYYYVYRFNKLFYVIKQAFRDCKIHLKLLLRKVNCKRGDAYPTFYLPRD